MEKRRGNIGDSAQELNAKTIKETPGEGNEEGSPAGEQREMLEFDLSTEKGLSGLLHNIVLKAQTEAFRDYITSLPESLGDRTGAKEMSALQIRDMVEGNPELFRAAKQDPRCAEAINLVEAIERLKKGEEVDEDEKSTLFKFIKTVAAAMRIGLEKIEKLEREARTDFLTALLNKRGFQEQLEREIELFERHSRPFLIVYLDMDDLKKINDEQGHHKGDEALISLAKTIKKNCRTVDHVARIGGDEFVILFSETDNEEIVSRLRSEVPNVSLGYYCYDGTISSAEEAIRIAERAMQDDKKKRKKGRE